MATRLMLHSELCVILGSDKVYYQPPSTVKMSYPCIIYFVATDKPKYADNAIYNNLKRYTITVVDRNPDSAIPDNLRNALRYCTFDRTYVADNLNHFVFSIYY